MEDSFSVRVDKTFGFLAGSSASVTSSSLSSLWSLTGEEIEKREWNRDKGSPEPELELRPCKDDFFGTELEKDLLDLDDDDDVEEEHEGVEEQQQLRNSSTQSAKPKPMPDDYNEEQWEIKSSIGLDCTLDHEVRVTLLSLTL